MKSIRKKIAAASLLLLPILGGTALLPSCTPGQTTQPKQPTPTPIPCSDCNWGYNQVGNDLQIAYGDSSGGWPQYASLNVSNGFLRLNYGPNCSWATSIIIVPTFWSGGSLHQGTPINASSPGYTWADFEVDFSGNNNGVSFNGVLTLFPPSINNSIDASVSVNATGGPTLDNRVCEAFQVVKLSSMNIDGLYPGSSSFDANQAYIGSTVYPLTNLDALIAPCTSGTKFGVTGGTNCSRKVPNVDITLNQPMSINGYVSGPLSGIPTPCTSVAPCSGANGGACDCASQANCDNVGIWAASNAVPSSWSYSIHVSK